MKKIIRFLTLAVLLAAPWGGYFNQVQAQATLTVYDGTATSSNVPVHGTWADAYLKCEFVIPATDLAAMDGCPITQMDFYLTSPASEAWTGTFQVFLKEVGSTTLDAYSGTTDATIVYEGTLDATSSTMTVPFDIDYDYGGGNLLVGVYQTITGNWKGATFAGTTVTGASGQGYSSSSLEGCTFSQKNFIPKTTFTYTPAAGYCFAPTSLVATVTPGSGTIATLNWTAGGTETDWVVEYSTASDFTGAASVNVSSTPTANLTGLTAEQTYFARVKTDCGGGSESAWSNTVTFTPTNAYTITVNDGTATNGYIPVYGYYVDGSIVSQFIIPAATLASIQYATINEMTFYASTATAGWASAQFEVYMTEVDYTTFSSTTLVDWASMTKVMNAAHLEISGNQMVVTLDSPYQYMGGNLMIGVKQTTSGSWGSCTWLGVSATGASLGGNNSGSQQNFLPKTTFSFTPGAAPTCPKPTDLTVDPITISAHDATLDWTENGTATQWQICLNGDEGNLVMANTTPYVLTTLDQDADYTVKVRAYCDASDQSDWSNTVNFHTLEACPAPTALTATNITSDAATLGWTGSASSYNVRYRVASAGGSSIDFETGFDDWTTIDADGDGYGWGLTDGVNVAAHGGAYCAYSESYSNDISSALTPDNYLVSPLVALGGTITFYAAAQDDQWAGEHFGVAVSTTSNTDPTAFTTIQEWTMTGTGAPAGAKTQGGWGQYTVNLSAYAGQTGYVAIRHFNCTDLFYIDIDDIVITAPGGGGPEPWINTISNTNSLGINGLSSETTYEYEVQADCGGEGLSSWAHATFATAVSCLPVTGLTFDAATATTADITWTAGASETAWKVYLYDGSDNLIAGYPVDVNTTSFTFTGLTANTPYKAGVKAACTSSDLSVEVFTTLRTACGVISTIPYEEGFEAAGIYCWTINGFTSDNTVGNAHTDNFYIYSNGYDAVAHYAVLPAFSTNISGLMLNFWYKNRYSNSDEGTLYVGYLTNAADYSSFVEVGSIDMSTSSDVYAESYDYVFDGAPAGSRIAFKYVGNGLFNSRVYIDDVTIVDRPACMKPIDLAVGEVASHTADLTWTGTSASYNIDYRVAAGISPELTEDFEGTTSWAHIGSGSAATDNTANYVHGGTKSLKFSGATADNVIVLPATSDELNTMVISFWSLAESSSNSGNFDVGYVTDAADAATFTAVGTYAASAHTSYVHVENVDLSGAPVGARAAFRHRSASSSWYWWIDDVVIGTPVAAGEWQHATSTTETKQLSGLLASTPYEVKVQGDCSASGDGLSEWSNTVNFTTTIPCPAPTALAYAELKSDRVNLSWNSSASDWQVYVYNVTSDAEVGTIDVTSSEVSIVGTTITYTLESLDPETEYTVKVRNNCEASYPGDGLSEWTTTVNFTTLEACGQPTGVTASDITNTTATISWTGDAPNFTVKYRIPAHMDGIEESFGTTPTGWTNMTGLLDDVMSSSATLTSGSQWSFGTSNGVFDNHARINIYGSSSSERKGWLITPAFTVPDGATMSFDLALTAYSGTLVAPATTGTDDRFVVLVYSDDAWHILREWNNSGSPYVYNDIPNTAAGETVDDIDISDYVGKNVKFAFYGESTVSNADNNLHIDNVVIGKPVDAGAWTNVDAGTATTQEISLLDPETKYEVVVVANCGTSPESAPVFFTTLAGITKNITADQWYAISSPMHNSSNDETLAGVTNLIPEAPVEYDLLRYNESAGRWESQKAGVAPFTTLERGRGYIYRRSTAATLTFVGQRNTGNVSRSITHSCSDVNIKGFNLVGNPYGVTYAPTNFYTLEPNGMWTVHTTGTVAAGEAFFVYETSNYSYAFTQPSGAKSAPRSNAATIALTVSNDDYSDIAYARFADGEGMPKMAHLNTEAPALSIPQGDRRYAIANLDENTESFPLHFSGFGEYTFSLSDNSLGLGYLHLIDRETGADVDMLRQSGYTFNANGNESERFVVLLRPTADANSFVRVSDSRLIVDGEGELQVFDVMGRQLGSAQVAGTATLDRSALGIVSAGVYVVRLGGNSQKIVVK